MVMLLFRAEVVPSGMIVDFVLNTEKPMLLPTSAASCLVGLIYILRLLLALSF